MKMKRLGMKFVSLFVTLVVLVMVTVPILSRAAQPTVNLGSTAEYAILAGSTITNIGTTTINGDVGGEIGLYPGTSFTGQETISVSGAIHIADVAAIQAKDDLVTAYDDAAGRTPVTRIPSELGGTTLTPGTYDSADGTFQITGTLTLDAQGDPEGVFIFKTASTLTTAADSQINLINSARFCRTFWQVGSSATLGTNSHFVGHILALSSITANTGASVQGQLLARNGAVTLDSNTITNGICETIVAYTEETVIDETVTDETVIDETVTEETFIEVPTELETATLHVVKHVINDNGGTAVAADFNLHVKTSEVNVAANTAPGAEAPGTTYTLLVGTYSITEEDNEEYTLSYSGDSDSSGNITLVAGDIKTVILTNNDVEIESVVETIVTPVAKGTVVVDETVTGGQLPDTSTRLKELFIMGMVLMTIGAILWKSKKQYE